MDDEPCMLRIEVVGLQGDLDYLREKILAAIGNTVEEEDGVLDGDVTVDWEFPD